MSPLRLLVALAAVGALVAARLVAAPSAEGLRTPLAPAPGGLAYAAAGGGLRLLGPAGEVERRGRLPGGLPLALAAFGDSLLLATDAGLQASGDGGRTWRRVRGGRFTAVAEFGPEAWAAAWAGPLWHSGDGGLTWSPEPVPAADTEVEMLSAGPAGVFAATLGGLLERRDGGWRRVPGSPGRVMALDQSAGSLQVAAWSGALYTVAEGGLRPGGATGGSGTWGLAGPAAATTQGLFVGASRVPALGGAEFTGVAASGSNLYAARARGPVYASAGQGWRPVLNG